MPILIRIENHTMAGKTIKIQHSLIFTQKGQQVMFLTTGKFFDSWFLFRTPVFRPKTVFCSFKRLSLSNSDACHSYITIIHIYFISRRSFWHTALALFVFLSSPKSFVGLEGVCTCNGTKTDVHSDVGQSNVIIRKDVPSTLPWGSRLHLGNSVFVCRGISWIRLFSLSPPPQEK